MGPDPKKLAALEQAMANLGIRRQDLDEKFIKSSGRGGQKVNKSSSAVFIRHRNTGLWVKEGSHRSRHLNRFIALRRLVEKIRRHLEGKDQSLSPDAEKIRKQKQRRKRRSVRNSPAGRA